ncbi:androgen-induced gene 1 protein isoform X2 [Syngnathoides biaculeatus]|uniref:androgen-induced gene 1 protein isoform X2 n=1 Tax=Syngnathoides biaculeatus TaxID=300417 RepID=UPI002ADE3F65|nr:androgen-induced gene 1 protein isoform X2 [Syngnathoides biaculeatus]
MGVLFCRSASSSSPRRHNAEAEEDSQGGRSEEAQGVPAGCRKPNTSTSAADKRRHEGRRETGAEIGEPAEALDMPAHQTYGGSWKFLTFIDLVIQAVFFAVCVLIDVSSLLTKAGENREQERQLRKLIGLRDWMMAVLAFPVGAFVVFTFWSLYLYDRELVYPKLLDNFIPQWLNHGMHTTVLPFIIIEMRTTHHRYPSRPCGLAAVCCFGVGYILWTCWVQQVTGMWVYPVLERITPLARVVFFCVLTAVICVFYLLGEILNSYIWYQPHTAKIKGE